MARPKLVSPDQPLPVRILLHFYEFAASLSLAVVLISLMAIALIFATFVEATFNTDVVQFYVYRSWWFGLIYGLLGVNIFCAAAIRYPWKRHQTGFVITHIGLLMLLLSGAISRSKGIDAQVHVWEHDSSELAFDNAYYFDLRVNNDAMGAPMMGPAVNEVQRHTIDFAPGMFNWASYGEGFKNWKVAEPDLAKWFTPVFYITMRNRAGNVMYNHDGVKLEVLDYYADCKWWDNTPTIQVMMSMPETTQRAADGRMEAVGEQWMPMRLSVFKATQQPKYKYGIGDGQRSGGGSMTFHMAGSRAATEAFLKCVPEEGSIGENGQAILYVDGKTTVIDVKEQLGKDPQPIEASDLTYQVKSYFPTAQLDQVDGKDFVWVEVPEEEGAEPRNPTVVIDILKGDEKVDQLTLLANMPQMNMQGFAENVYGHYWYDFGEKDAAQLMRGGDNGSRIDLIQGVAEGAEDESSTEAKRVFYRYWNRKKVVASGELKSDATELDAVDAFKMPFATLRMYVKSLVAASEPMAQPAPLPFGASGPMGNTPAVKVRLTVQGETDDDTKTEEFWLRAHMNEPDVGLDDGSTLHTLTVGDREVKLSMPIKSYPIGFRIQLDQFERRLDPGTSQPSHYSSDVQYLDRQHDRYFMRSPSGSDQFTQLEVVEARNPTSIGKAGSMLYWIDVADNTQKILVKDLSKPEEPATEIVTRAGKDPRDLVVDTAGNKLWWLAKQSSRLARSDVDVLMQADLFSGSPTAVTMFDRTPRGLAVDSESGWVYFGNPAGKAIGRVRDDGSEMETSWLKGAGVVTALAIDPEKKTIYFADDANNAIGKSSTEDPRTSYLYTYTKEGRPNSLAVDTQSKLLYWSDETPNGIDPNARKHLGDPAIDRSAPQEINTVIRVLDLSKPSSDPEVLHAKLLNKPDGLAIDPDTGDLLFTQTALLKRDVWITMNAPDDFTEPAGGRDLRIFQESFEGPYLAGTAQYREFVPKRSNDSEVYKSVFSVNYDPGTALRYWGCLFVIGGIACMFYMRAYFFKTKRTSDPQAKAKAHPTTIKTEVVS
ncbi:NHL repeat-containing protein [Bremerella sp. T1]|uniref:hypothetical protein n=1 Tax=Bremerella sp. TYQ1 TaxID=3119568 RepID=UPI001CCFD135|nr:hypothetical protein [Bremerella volcania]UBM38618.1 hypothetical protein LA756_12135 [Bremerella volcania]